MTTEQLKSTLKKWLVWGIEHQKEMDALNTIIMFVGICCGWYIILAFDDFGVEFMWLITLSILTLCIGWDISEALSTNGS